MKIQKLIIKMFMVGIFLLLPLMQFGQATCDEFVLELLSDTTVEVMRGDRAYWTVSVRTLVDEYNGTIRFRAYRPEGCLATWTPPDGEITPTIRQIGSVLELRTNGATPGTHTFNIAAIDETAQIKSEVRVTLVVLEEDFEIDVTPPERQVCQGESTSYNVDLTPLNGFDSQVTLAVNGLPAGAQGTFTPNPVNPDGSSTLNITTTNSVALGTYTLTITGSGGGKEHSRTVTFIVDNANCEDFEINVTPPEQRICQGGSTSYDVDITGIMGFDSPVTLSVSGLPGGAQGTFTPNPVNPDGSSTLNITTTNSVPLGTYTLTITGTGGGKVHSRTVTFIVDNENCEDFEINVTPPERQVCQGDSTSYTVNITGVMGFDSPVTLSVSGLPGGAQGTFTVNPVNPDGSSTLNITTTNSVALGTYTLTITGTSGEKVHSRTVTFIVDNENCEDFEINVTPPEQRICQGDSTSYTVNITGVMGFNSPVTLSVSGLPGGAQGTFSPNPVNPDGSSTLNITTTNSVALGTYTLTITGTSGEKVHSRTVTFIVDNENCEDFEINVTPPEQRICQGDSTSYTVNITGIMGFSSPVTLSVSGLPGGAQGTFSPNPVNPDGSSTLNITTTDSVALGTYTLTITGTSGEKVHSSTVTFIVDNENCEDFEIEVTPGRLTLCRGESNSYTVNITGLRGFNSPVNLSVTGLPSGVTHTFTPGSVTPDGQSVLTVTASATAATGTFNLTVTGAGGDKEHSVQVTLRVRNCDEPDFDIDINPPELTVTCGEEAEYDVTLSSINGFNSPVTLTVTGLPDGSTATFSPDTVTPDGHCQLKIATGPSVSGVYDLTVTGSGGGKEASVHVTLIIICETPDPSYQLDVTPDSREVCRGLSASYNVNLTSLEGFNSPVTLSVTGLPAGAVGTFSENPVTPTGSSVLDITTSDETPFGTYTLTIQGDSGGLIKEDTVTLTIIDSRFSVQIEANPITGTVPLAVKFQALITQQGEFPLSQYTFHWDFGDGGTAVDQNPEHTYEKPGKYNVVLDVTGPCGQGETASLEISATSRGGEITKKFSQSEVQPGDEVTMTITAINNTDFHFENVVIRDTLSQYLEYLDDDASVEPIRSGRELKWKFARLRSGESLTINVKLRVSMETPPGKIVNIATLSYDNLSKEIPSNPAELIVYKIEVLLEKSVDKTIANPGEHIKYQLRLTNNSSIPLSNIKLTDVLPSHLEYVTQSGALDFSIEGQNIQYTGTLDPGQTVEISIEAMVKTDTLGGTVIENCAAVQADQLREEVKSNCVITTVPDQPGPPINVRFIKRADVPQSGVGRIVGFTLTIINESDYTLKTPTIEDYFPQGFNYVPGSTLLNGQPFDDPQGKRRVVWQLPDIKPRETVIMRYQVVIGADVRRGTNVNRAWLQSGDLLLEASDIVSISGPGIIFYCGLEGFVYLDLDCNGVFNYGDTPLEGIEVRLSSGEKAVTDKFGHYIFEDLYPGDYVVSINPNSLPDMYVINGESPTLVVLSEGLTDNVNFGLKYKDGNAVSGTASLELEAVCPEAIEASKLKGQPFTLKFIIRNTGEVDLYNVVIKDTLPQYFQYVPGSSRLDDSTIDEPQGVPGPSLEWQIGTLGKGQSKTFLFQAAADVDIKATIYKNQAFAEAVIACAEITTDIQECKLAIYEGPGCCPQVEEAAVGSFAKPEAPLSFIEPYFHTETAMCTVYAVFKLWNGQSLQKDGMPLFMKERLQNYARSTVEEFYLNSRMGITLPDGSIRLSFAGAYPEKDPETKVRRWLRKNVDETMTVSQIAWELLGLNETVKEEKRVEVKSRLETILKEKLVFLEEFINDMDNMPHGWEITRQAKEHGKSEEDTSYKLKRFQEKASPYDKASLYLAMVELSRGGYNQAEGFAAKIRASLAADKIDDKSFVWSHRHAEFMFILALLENRQKDAAADKIKAFEELLKQGLQLNDLHTYALAAAVDKKAGGTLYEGIAAKMKKKFYLQDTGIFADNQPDFTFKVSLENIAPLLLFFADDGENLELNAVTLYRTFDEVGIFLKKRNLNIGKQPLYGLLKNYPFAQPLLPILSFTQGDRDVAPVFSKDAIVHTSRVKPLGERLIPDTFSKILSPGYETSISRIAALSFSLQDFAERLMLHQEPVIREEGRSFAVSGRKYIETLLKSGAGITKDGNLLLPYDHISVKGNRNAEGDSDLEPMHVKQVFSTQTLANYLLAEKYYVDGAGKQTETVRRLMDFQARIVEELLKDGVPETFRVFIESGTEKITVAVKGQASKITAAKLLLLYPGNSVLKSVLNKPGEKLEPEDLLFLSGAPEFVPYFKKEIKEVIDRRDSKITDNAADILGRYLLRQIDGTQDSIDNLLKHWDKDSVLPKSDQVETIERGIIYHHQPLHLLLYLSALQPSSPEAPVSFRFERTLNILTYLLETEWGLFGNSDDRLPSAQYLVFKEQPSEYFQAGDLINLRVRLENNCAQGLGSAGYNPSFFIKAWFNPALVYYGTQYVEGLRVLGDFLWRYDGLPAGKVLEYIYQVFVPYEFRAGSVEGGIALRSRMGYEDFGPETASGIICEESGLLAGMKIVPLQEIPGIVFEDRNGNGKKDGNEPGIPNILIKESRGRVLDVDTKDRMLRSDAEGRFRIFARDQHEGVQLELRDLPAQYVLMSDPTRLVNRNYSGEIYFPLVPCRTVSGVVIDKDNDTPVEGVLLTIKVNDFEKEVFSGKDGVFVFRNVPLAWEDGLVEIDAKQPFYKGSGQSLKLTFNKPSVINK